MKPYSKTLICDSETPVSLFQKLAGAHPYAFLLESAESHERFGKYSFIGFDPLKLHTFEFGAKENPLTILQKSYKSINYIADPTLPRLQAGFVGYFTYETARHFEKLNLPMNTEERPGTASQTEIPEGIFYFPKNLLIFDHFSHTITLVAYDKKALAKLVKEYHQALKKPAKEAPQEKITKEKKVAPNRSNPVFESLVEKAKEDIRAGEVFQIVLCQLFQQKTDAAPFDIYRKLRLKSPSPYMYYLQYPNFSIIGSSPETLVRTENNEIILRPIAGTRRRGKDTKEDAQMATELLLDTKEQAEHMMLVDLGRNDVGRIAVPGTVHVTRMMEVERFSHVMHLVSEVRGKRDPKTSLFEIFKTAFPAGTLTGAPKIRAMEIIAQLEKRPRGIYGGAVGYFDMSGNMDFAIAIRTMVHMPSGRSGKKGSIALRAGAGIVYDSVPAHENLECHNKAKGPLSAL